MIRMANHANFLYIGTSTERRGAYKKTLRSMSAHTTLTMLSYIHPKEALVMDLIKIGNFIAQLRKGKGLTQARLADMIGVSDKTISKWERGGGLPDVSLMLPLCYALEINVNELLTGERLIDAEYKKKAEDNMMSLIKEREENKKKLVYSAVIGLTAFLSFIAILVVVVVYTDEIPDLAKGILMAAACAVFVIGFISAVHGERTIGYYKCGVCGKKFIPSYIEYAACLKGFTGRRMKCPDCGKKTWCKKVMSKED